MGKIEKGKVLPCAVIIAQASAFLLFRKLFHKRVVNKKVNQFQLKKSFQFKHGKVC